MDSDTHFSLLLGTNHAATKEETPKLEEFIAVNTPKLSGLEEEMLRVLAHYEDLRRQHAAFSRKIEDHRALLAPVRRLHVDVIQDIFLWCIPQKLNANMSRHECPILLTQICSGWRQIALKTAALWKSIHVPIPLDDKNGMSHQGIPLSQPTSQRKARGIVEWLGRSGACALNISVQDDVHSRGPPESYANIFTALLTFSNRWGVFTCDVNSNMEYIAALPASAFPRLHTLTVHGYIGAGHLNPEDESPPLNWANSGILRAPNLRNIFYRKTVEDLTLFPLRWGQLTSIFIDTVGTGTQLSLKKLTTIFTTCPLLRFCHLKPNTSHVPPRNQPDITCPTRTQKISLPHLTDLIIDSENPKMAKIFYMLDVPSLERLESFSCFAAYLPLLDILHRTSQTLLVLALHPHVFSRNQLISCLTLTPNLVKFKLISNYNVQPIPNQGNIVDVTLLRSLCSSEGHMYGYRRALLPRLRSFICQAPCNLSEGCVLEVIQGRQAAAAANGSKLVSKLTRVDVWFPHFRTLPMAEAEERLAEDGIKCRFEFPKLRYGPIIQG